MEENIYIYDRYARDMLSAFLSFSSKWQTKLSSRSKLNLFRVTYENKPPPKEK